jgi:4-amino-4-deoxy-L-arabinose transferase-like glycosyltransferase
VNASRQDALVAVAGVALYALLAVGSMREKSAVFDEGAYLPAGYTHWKFRDFRLTPEQPPLAKLLAAAPLLFTDVTVHEDDAWALRRPWDFGRNFLYAWNDAGRLLFRARLAIVALGAALALAVFWWTRLHWGRPAAALALLLCVLSPDVLAHGQIVTMDLGVTLFIFLAVAAFERLTERATPLRLLAAGLATGAAFATKSSAFLLLPILGALAARTALASEPWRVSLGPLGSRSVETRAGRALHLCGFFAAIAALALAVLWACYLFQPRLSPDPDVAAAFEWERNWPQGPVAGAAASVARGSGLLPEAYVFGVLKVFAHAEGRPAFLAGERSDAGWWRYYPATIALKTPLALFALLLLALLTRPAPRAPPRASWFLWLPPLLYLLLAASRPINIGHRYVLPLYPFLFVAAGRAAAWAFGQGRPAAARWLLAALAAVYAQAALRVHPHYLAYFNELAGGPSNGYRYLVDSNLDWGQDLEGLASWLRENPVGRIKLAYFGSADPRYYGIDCDLLPGYMAPPPPQVTRRVRPGDVVAVSATILQGLYAEPAMQPLFARLRATAPLAVVAHTIFVYRVEFEWAPDPDGAAPPR